MKNQLKNLVDSLPYIKGLKKELTIYKTKFPPGHFESPYPSIKYLKEKEETFFNKTEKDNHGINFNKERQLELLKSFIKHYQQLPFGDEKKPGLRYNFLNTFFRYTDGIMLYSMMREFRPSNIIEVGSGFSSAVILDTNELFFENKINCTFIEPYPERLLSILKPTDKISLHQKEVQDVNFELYKNLKENDILFIDSSHVSKTGSDVNTIFFDILPILNKGVIIHFHDIFYPFEYPKEWVLNGRAWNEIYLLKAFLMYNNQFEIILQNNFVGKHYKEWLKENLPLCLNDIGGSIWLRKI